MKALATGLLAGAAAIYVAMVLLGDRHGGWVGYVRAGAEAAMVGGLADWFAVTALFRHPLGLPIPHTALIPRQKDALAGQLGGFVTEHFLTPEAIHERVRAAQPTRKLGAYLSEPTKAARWSREIARVGADALDALDPRDTTEYVLELIRQDQLRRSYAPTLGRLMAEAIGGTTHQPLIEMLIERAHTFLVTNEETVRRELKRVVEGTGFLAWLLVTDKRIARAVHAVRDTLSEMKGDPQHALRRELDELLSAIARDLQTDSETARRVDALITELLEDRQAHAILGDLVADVSASVITSLREPDGELQRRIETMLTTIARRAQDDDEFIARVDGMVLGMVEYGVRNYGDSLTKLIQEQVSKWSGADTSRRIEGFVGRDLQFIRLNGTAVGALAGVGIHTVTLLL
jgi:uncharacterized membrane-anchored protein YjiN (DUF445 family)